MNRKGISGPIISIFIMLGVILFIFLAFTIFALIGPALADAFNTVTEVMQKASVNKTIENATAQTFTKINPVFQNLQWISYTLLVFLFMGFIFLAFFVRAYPFLIIFWIGGMLVLVIASIFMSDAYNDITNSSIGDQYTAWSTNNFIMGHLPHIFSTMGLLGGFILFVIASRDTEVEASAI